MKLFYLYGLLHILFIELLAMDGYHSTLAPSSGAANDQVCIYCHVPHAANGASSIGPLWNKRASLKTFEMYGTTMAGNPTAGAPTNQSAACLSCHDGVSAMNSVINAPGSGNQNIYAVNPLNPTTFLLAGPGDPTAIRVMGAFISAVGYDELTNDHPISIKYIVGNAGLRETNTVLSTTNSGGTAWLGATVVKDLLRGPNKDTVECVSCHDPHNGYFSMYRRMNNNNSDLCFGCHDK
ncbi:MAG: cytochrome c3 family protein [Sulfurimonas sp.]|nr:cytochrome c3 family protein [Sulfurimonas sp.]